MKFSTIATICCMTASVAAAPQAIPVPETEFSFGMVSRELDEVADIVDDFSDILSKRDEQTIASILDTLNSSGIIWELLDKIAESPVAIQGLANYTGLLVGKVNLTSIIESTLSKYEAGTLYAPKANVSGILQPIIKSGLLQSIAQGTIMDPKIQPVLAKIIENVIHSNEDLILYVFTALTAKRNHKRADNSGSLTTLVTNLAGSILGSSYFQDTLTDTVNALNDTGFVVYTIQRFLLTPAYVNMTGELVSDLMKSGDIKLDNIGGLLKSINITELIVKQLGDPSKLVNIVTSLLSGKVDTKGLTSVLGQYTTGVKAIIKIMEKDGLFVYLNDLLFGSPSSTTTAASTSKASTSTKKDVAVATQGKNEASSSSSAGSPGSSLYVPSYFVGALIGVLLL